MVEELKDVYEEQNDAENTFRDSLATVDEEGKRIWLYPKKPKGRFTNWRNVVNSILLIILIGSPFVTVGGQPLMLFDIFERKFILFGQIFWPQDFHLFVIAMTVLVLFIVLFTVVYGRIFCGWICPQTIFMEGVFRKIEYWIEGDYVAQKKLDKQPWNSGKILKKSGKQFLFIVVSTVIMHTFMAYLIGVESTWEIIVSGPATNPGGFVGVVVVTGLFYGVFSIMREQVCTTICPYGRLQGVLLDRNSVIVGYDHIRGESRSKFRKDEDRKVAGKGDCIDCKQCVYVCPTGIDIRNGTQLECVNCTACIDACDSIMDRIDKPRGLVRYASEANIADNKSFEFTARIKAYSVLLVLLIVALVSLLIIRSDFETTILRQPGMTFQKRDDGRVSNLYQMKMVNKTSLTMNVRFELLRPAGELQMVKSDDILLEEQGIAEGAFFVIIDPKDLDGMSSKIEIGVFSGEEQIETVKTKFLGPMSR
ncbi:MAG: cytochrome c oxidase accessory protein CcoG [Cytophagales bacterium]|nr:cytochrome c oxidase accessory protein CcoG [Cytophagales bacterium]